LGHTGLRPAADVMPKTGSARYAGTAFAFLDRGAKKQTVQAWGTTTITANFGATTSTMTLTGSLVLDATGVAENGEAIYSGGTATMTGAGAITGNEFTGSVVTGLTGMAGAADVVIGGSMAGAFYGPAADEVVGYFDTAGTVTTTSFGTEDVRLMGGFATVVTP
ncbi:MAG: transferrin-binding protein-like solute binding protein, partial [Alphaproteobacteria bacterium]|nr:transferrin-binding protein-like solute binding protein [Alphaproteobacteria bacterium]